MGWFVFFFNEILMELTKTTRYVLLHRWSSRLNPSLSWCSSLSHTLHILKLLRQRHKIESNCFFFYITLWNKIHFISIYVPINYFVLWLHGYEDDARYFVFCSHTEQRINGKYYSVVLLSFHVGVCVYLR